MAGSDRNDVCGHDDPHQPGRPCEGMGFAVVAIGSVAWTIVGLCSRQVSLIAANGLLTFINFVGIGRWLGRQRAYEDGG
ncbi:hypothetical protein [Novosphingobium resinovorum]|uniref:hypothetical protein n=1 Tax=Novosphingobium resinovorum TaxID=158500 RepID=UPI0012E9ABA1|nr:hypothetical protein [Novosphingobium resinovorum]